MVRVIREEATATPEVPEPASPPAETQPDLAAPGDEVKDDVGGVVEKEDSKQDLKIRNLQAELQKSIEELKIVNLEMELQKSKAEISGKMKSLNMETEDIVPKIKIDAKYEKSTGEKSTGDEQVILSKKDGKNNEEAKTKKRTKKINPLVKSRMKSSKAKTSKKDV
jgi:hypothetical protein